MAKIVDSERNAVRRRLAVEEVEAFGMVIEAGGTPVLVLVAMADGEGGYALYRSPASTPADREMWRCTIRKLADAL